MFILKHLEEVVNGESGGGLKSRYERSLFEKALECVRPVVCVFARIPGWRYVVKFLLGLGTGLLLFAIMISHRHYTIDIIAACYITYNLFNTWYSLIALKLHENKSNTAHGFKNYW